jgi:hypothetical protein
MASEQERARMDVLCIGIRARGSDATVHNKDACCTLTDMQG